MNPPVCPDCGRPLVCFCPACRGRAGGQKRTAKQAKAARKALEKNRRKRWRPKAD